MQTHLVFIYLEPWAVTIMAPLGGLDYCTFQDARFPNDIVCLAIRPNPLFQPTRFILS